MLLPYAYSGSADVDAVVAAFVLAATPASVSAGGIGRTESSTMGSVRACGESQVQTAAATDTCSGLDALLLQSRFAGASGCDALARAGRPKRNDVRAGIEQAPAAAWAENQGSAASAGHGR